MGVQIFINFDNTSNTFRPGDLITGNVTINTSENVTSKGLTLSIHGVGRVSWSETKTITIPVNPEENDDLHQRSPHFNFVTGSDEPLSPFHRLFHDDYQHHRQLQQPNQRSGHQEEGDNSGPRSVERKIVKEYRNTETYLINQMFFPVGPPSFYQNGNNSAAVELPAGYFQQIPIRFQLPLNLPSSCKLTHGDVKYFVEASLTVRKSLLFISKDVNETVKREFNILGYLDLALVNEALSPLQLKKSRQFGGILCCCCCISGGEGKFMMDLRLARSGFVPGESIIFTLNFYNDTGVIVKQLKADLTQTITFVTFGKERQEVHVLDVIAYSSRITPGSSGTWSDRLKIPQSALLSDLGGCRIIQVKYILTIKAKASFMRKISLEIPITVGTVGDRAPYSH